jgi:hypothetical protein
MQHTQHLFHKTLLLYTHRLGLPLLFFPLFPLLLSLCHCLYHRTLRMRHLNALLMFAPSCAAGPVLGYLLLQSLQLLNSCCMLVLSVCSQHPPAALYQLRQRYLRHFQQHCMHGAGLDIRSPAG